MTGREQAPASRTGTGAAVRVHGGNGVPPNNAGAVQAARLRACLHAAFAAAVIAALALPAIVQAQHRIGFVNISVIMKNAPQARSAKSRLESEFSGQEQELIGLEKQIGNLEKKLRRSKDKLSEAERNRAKKSLRVKKREFKLLRDDIRESFSRRNREELGKMRNLVYEVVGEIAEKRGIDLIVSEPVLYASDQANLTDEVLEVLKKRGGSASGRSSRRKNPVSDAVRE